MESITKRSSPTMFQRNMKGMSKKHGKNVQTSLVSRHLNEDLGMAEETKKAMKQRLKRIKASP